MKPLLCRDVTKSYGDTRALDRVSAEIAAGAVTAVVGPNGAGKTTFLRICARLQHPDAGTVEVPSRIVYYGGFETLPMGGTVAALRRAVGLPEESENSRRKLKHLSRGQLHGVGLSMAFELPSDALLLDEPWTALDPEARERCSERISAAARDGRIVVCSSHDLDEVARIANAVMFLANGRAHFERENTFDRQRLMDIYRRSMRS